MGDKMDLSIEKLHVTDAEELYKFELENRAYFEEMVPSRGDDYYRPDIFRKRHQDLLDEQAQGSSLFYLIKDENGSIVGRMNLIDIDEEEKTGHLGYRIGQSYTKKGIATKALKSLIEEVEKYNIKQIFAKTTQNNRASQKVLEKNGFEQIDSDEVIEMNGQQLKFVCYSWEQK